METDRAGVDTHPGSADRFCPDPSCVESTYSCPLSPLCDPSPLSLACVCAPPTVAEAAALLAREPACSGWTMMRKPRMSCTSVARLFCRNTCARRWQRSSNRGQSAMNPEHSTASRGLRRTILMLLKAGAFVRLQVKHGFQLQA